MPDKTILIVDTYDTKNDELTVRETLGNERKTMQVFPLNTIVSTRYQFSGKPVFRKTGIRGKTGRP